MKPQFLDEMDKSFAVRQHVILTLNTQDRFYWPEGEIRPCSLTYFLYHHYRRQGYRVVLYVPAIGGSEMTPDGRAAANHPVLTRLVQARGTTAVLSGLFDLLRIKEERWIVLVQYGEHISPAGTGSEEERHAVEILHQIGLNDDVACGNSRMVVMAYEGMPATLITQSPAWRIVQAGLPCQEERQSFVDFLESLRSGGRQEFGELEQGFAPAEFARATAGMPLIEIEGLYRAAGHFRTPITRTSVRESKSRAIRQLARDLLQVNEPVTGFAGVAGMATLKEYFNRLLIPQIRAGRPAPQAILLHGEPGCGKSHVVNAIAYELGWPMLEFRNVRSPYVGQSEQQLEHVINVVEQLSPCVLFFDEIDQAMGQRSTGASGDSGTSERMLARIFNWLGSMHLRGRVLFVGASNRPDLLDPALLDRFRVSIPVLKPTISEIGELVSLLLARFERACSVEMDEAARLLASLRPSGRTLQEVIVQAGMLADAGAGETGQVLGLDHIESAAHDCLNPEDPLELEFIRLTSLSLASSQSLLPWNGLAGLRALVDIPMDLREMGVVSDNGRLEKTTLHERLRRLAAERQTARMMR